MKNLKETKFARLFTKALMFGVVGMASMNMTGCGIDDITAGITSNLCVLEGKCNGSTFM